MSKNVRLWFSIEDLDTHSMTPIVPMAEGDPVSVSAYGMALTQLVQLFGDQIAKDAPHVQVINAAPSYGDPIATPPQDWPRTDPSLN